MEVKLINGAEDIEGCRLLDVKYILILFGATHSVIEAPNKKQYYVNNKYIEKLPRSKWSRLFLYVKKSAHK